MNGEAEKDIEALITALEEVGIKRETIVVPDSSDPKEVTILLQGQFSEQVWEAILATIPKSVSGYPNWIHGGDAPSSSTGAAIVYKYANNPEFTLKKSA